MVKYRTDWWMEIILRPSNQAVVSVQGLHWFSHSEYGDVWWHWRLSCGDQHLWHSSCVCFLWCFGEIDWLMASRQFGNMLVLSTTYTSSLSKLVDCNVLEWLLTHTIHFLLQSQNISPSLQADAFILMEVYKKIFSQPSSSFLSVWL